MEGKQNRCLDALQFMQLTYLYLIYCRVPQPTGAGEAVSDKAFTVPTAVGAQTMPSFNPATINLHDLVALQRLKHPELNKVAKFHNQKAAGTNEAIIKCLRALAMSTPPSAVPIPPPPALAAPIPPSSHQSQVSASIPAPPQLTVNSLHYPYYHAPTYQYTQF